MMRELLDASGAFLVRGPMINCGGQGGVLRNYFQHHRGACDVGSYSPSLVS